MKTKQLFSVQIDNYQSFLMTDYKPSTISRYTKIVLDFLVWEYESYATQSIPIELSIGEFIYLNRSTINNKKDFKTIRAAMNMYYYHLTGIKFQQRQNIIKNEFVKNKLDEYKAYLGEVVGLAETTKLSHMRYINRFLNYIFPEQEVNPSKISVIKVQNFLTIELSHLKPTSRKTIIGTIRSYVRFLQFKGIQLDIGLLTLPLASPVWRLSSVPKTFKKEDIDNILASYDLSTSVGIRDYAIALCFTEFGLRVSEVANITIDDFNWREGKLRIKKTKTHMERELPLSKSVGEAIVKYLKNARPETSERTLFARFSHHCGDAMGSQQIRRTIRSAYSRVGISPAITGTHIIRHTKAKRMYENGSSLKLIADILGHESIDTTVIYTKVGLSALCSVTCTWPLASTSEVDYE